MKRILTLHPSVQAFVSSFLVNRHLLHYFKTFKLEFYDGFEIRLFKLLETSYLIFYPAVCWFVLSRILQFSWMVRTFSRTLKNSFKNEILIWLWEYLILKNKINWFTIVKPESCFGQSAFSSSVFSWNLFKNSSAILYLFSTSFLFNNQTRIIIFYTHKVDAIRNYFSFCNLVVFEMSSFVCSFTCFKLKSISLDE